MQFIERNIKVPTTTGKHILLVEDNTALLKLLVGVLDEVGYDMVTAATGAEAIERLSSGRFDLGIFDYWLQDILGTKVATSFQKTNPKAKILFITGYEEPLMKELAANAEIPTAWTVLIKPFPASTLIAKIEELLAPA